MRENPAGESKNTGLKLLFDRRLRLEFRGAKITTDAGLLAVRELDEMMGLTEMAADLIVERRTGKNVQHQIPGLLRQSVYARLAGYEDTNDHEGLSRDPAMRAVIGKRALERTAASSGTVSRFETDILSQEQNIDALATLNSSWVSKAVSRSFAKKVILDIDSSESPVHGNQEGSAYNGFFESTCYHSLFCFNNYGDCEGAVLRPGNVHSAKGWREFLAPIVNRYKEIGKKLYLRGGCGLRLAGHLRVPGGQERPLCHQAQGEQQPLPGDRPPDDETGGKALCKAEGILPCLFLPGGIMEEAEEGRRQGGVASRRAVSPNRFHRHQHVVLT